MATNRRKRNKPEDTPPEDELETLEPLDEGDELETLEPIEEDGDVLVSHEVAADGAEIRFTVTAPEMDKTALVDAIVSALARQIETVGDALRLRRATIEFAGETLIPSAAKERVGELFATAGALTAIMRRGYGEECVHEREMPTLDVRTTRDGDELAVRIDTGGFVAAEIAQLLPPAIEEIVGEASDTAVALSFAGTASLDDALVGGACDKLIGAGVRRLTISVGGGSPRVVHDREYEEAVSVGSAGAAGFDLEVAITPSRAPAVTEEALDFVLGRVAGEVQGKRIVVKCAGDQGVDVLAACERLAELGAASIVHSTADGRSELLWPALLSLSSRKSGTTLEVEPGGRDAVELRSAFARELDALADELRNKPVTVDWPVDFTVDDDLARGLLDDVMAPAGPASVSFSFGGEDKEPMLPTPVTFSEAGEGKVMCTVDTDVGTPAELTRALKRRFGAARVRLEGQDVIVRLDGHGMVSRSMRREMRDLLEADNVIRACIDDHGTIDVLTPQLFRFETNEGDALRLHVTLAGRTRDQVERDAARALEHAEVGEGTTVDVESTEHDDAIVGALVAAGAGRVLVDGRQVHPPVEATPEVEEEVPVHDELEPEGLVEAAAEPGAEPEPERPLVAVLGRRDQGEPPITLLGVEAGGGAESVQAIEAALGDVTNDTAGRRVLVAFQRAGVDVAAPDGHPVAAAVRAVLEPTVAALLVLRQGAEFEVVHSTIDTLAVGARVRDPRAPR